MVAPKPKTLAISAISVLVNPILTRKGLVMAPASVSPNLKNTTNNRITTQPRRVINSANGLHTTASTIPPSDKIGGERHKTIAAGDRNAAPAPKIAERGGPAQSQRLTSPRSSAATLRRTVGLAAYHKWCQHANQNKRGHQGIGPPPSSHVSLPRVRRRRTPAWRPGSRTHTSPRRRQAALHQATRSGTHRRRCPGSPTRNATKSAASAVITGAATGSLPPSRKIAPIKAQLSEQ